MKTSTLQEVAKFASGLVVGDFLVGLWLYQSGLLPMWFWGILWTPRLAVAGMVFDVLLFAWLVHVGWRRTGRAKNDSERQFHYAAGWVFAIVAIVHFSRIVWGWQFSLVGWPVPYWLNGIGTILTGFLSYVSFHLAQRSR